MFVYTILCGNNKIVTIYTYSIENTYNYSWYDDLSRQNISFITRQVSNDCVEEIKSYGTGLDDVYDYDIILGSDYSKNKTKFKN